MKNRTIIMVFLMSVMLFGLSDKLFAQGNASDAVVGPITTGTGGTVSGAVGGAFGPPDDGGGDDSPPDGNGGGDAFQNGSESDSEEIEIEKKTKNGSVSFEIRTPEGETFYVPSDYDVSIGKDGNVIITAIGDPPYSTVTVITKSGDKANVSVKKKGQKITIRNLSKHQR